MNPLGTTLDAQLGSWANNNYAANPCKDKGQALGPEGQAIQDALDAELKRASGTTDPAIQAEAYQMAQRIALENAWIYNPSMHRVNYMGCYTPKTGGCGRVSTYTRARPVTSAAAASARSAERCTI